MLVSTLVRLEHVWYVLSFPFNLSMPSSMDVIPKGLCFRYFKSPYSQP